MDGNRQNYFNTNDNDGGSDDKQSFLYNQPDSNRTIVVKI